ncbi:MAG TPA: formate dehydrogenase accessory protein FdhE [Candidatus Limnocylindria bacterium]|nr:formate dehydrogenase accessory protein FdhE [Candidatus Limnocylindria bacterium]
MTASIDSDVQDLGRQRPEWQPWLSVVQQVLRETADVKWDTVIPDRAEPLENKAPVLAGASIAIETSWLRRWTQHLIGTASRSGTEKMATLKGVLQGTTHTLSLFKAALRLDQSALKQIAVNCDADPEAFQAVTALLPVPFLHACNRRWANSLPQGWAEGYCPVCGSWPAVAEVRGIDRSRYFRCGRCASAWPVNCLVCAYCGMTDHEQLVSLVPEQGGNSRVIEACKHCLGYVKTFTTLQASPAARVILDDLASVDLDIAAVEHGYKRPQGAGYLFDVTVVDKITDKFSFWRA